MFYWLQYVCLEISSRPASISMDEFWRDFTRKDWEKFCETMLRQHHGYNHFWSVPDDDQGDCGIEFFTGDGCIYQCYFPDTGVSMETYKKNAQTKIREDLKKLKKNESQIALMLDGIVVRSWFLLMPENKSKELTKYCNNWKKRILKENISYVDPSEFVAKIETADSFPEACLYARRMRNRTQAIDIPIEDVPEEQRALWLDSNTEFAHNIERKTDLLVSEPQVAALRNRVVAKYIQIEKFLEILRDEAPDLFDLVEGSGRALLEEIHDGAILEEEIGKEFVKRVYEKNQTGFRKYTSELSEGNVGVLPFGYLSKWIAECRLDFLDT